MRLQNMCSVADDKDKCFRTPLTDACKSSLDKRECPAGYKEDSPACVSFLVNEKINGVGHEERALIIKKRKATITASFTKKVLVKT